jgi:hypothetical protein
VVECVDWSMRRLFQPCGGSTCFFFFAILLLTSRNVFHARRVYIIIFDSSTTFGKAIQHERKQNYKVAEKNTNDDFCPDDDRLLIKT